MPPSRLAETTLRAITVSVASRIRTPAPEFPAGLPPYWSSPITLSVALERCVPPRNWMPSPPLAEMMLLAISVSSLSVRIPKS
jgi:hypothetical protein